MEGIKRRRKQKAWTQAMLAQRLHVTQQSVAKWENGKAQPRADRLAACAKALGCSVDELFWAGGWQKRPEMNAKRGGMRHDS